MDVLNFISWIKRKDYREVVPENALIVVGVPDPTRDDKYLSVVVPVSSLVTGATGTFTAGIKTVTVVDGLITSII
jgi:hypothetical protein